MKKIALITTLILGTSVAFAQFDGGTTSGTGSVKGGYTGAQSITTVSQIDSLSDDTHVVLEGVILKHLGGEKYLFKDSTGEIEIEIDHDDWRGVSVGPEDTVILYGEIDHHHFKATDIDVDRIQKK